MQRQGRNCQETIVQAWGRVLVPRQAIYITTSLSCFTDTETPTRWEQLRVWYAPAHRLQTSWNQKVDDADSHLPHHKPISRMSLSRSRSLWTITVKLLTTLPRAGHSFEGISPLGPPLPGRAIKLFFSTSPKTLPLKFNSVSGYRGQMQLQYPVKRYMPKEEWLVSQLHSLSDRKGRIWISVVFSFLEIFSDFGGGKLESHNQKITRKSPNIWKSKNT